jgi:hypothetical protein
LPAQVILANYIVRIYRFNKNKPGHLVGVVEEVGLKGKKAFTNYDELWEILICSKKVFHLPSFSHGEEVAFKERRES